MPPIFEENNGAYQNRAIESTTDYEQAGMGYSSQGFSSQAQTSQTYTNQTDYGTENIESESFLENPSKTNLSRTTRSDSLLKRLKKRFSSIDQTDGDSIDRRCSVRKTKEEWNKTYLSLQDIAGNDAAVESHHDDILMTEVQSTCPTEEIAQTHVDHATHSTLRTYTLIIALSLHAVFEGLAVEIQTQGNSKNENKIWQFIMFLGMLSIHKVVVAFSTGLNLIQSKLPVRTVFTCIIIFSSMAPIGIILGRIIAKLGDKFTFETEGPMAVINGLSQCWPVLLNFRFDNTK